MSDSQAHAGQDPEPSLHTSLIHGIRLLARLARVAERTCQSSGVSLPQYRLLLAAYDRPARASELADSIGVTRPTLTSLVDGLEQAGLLRRVRLAADRRAVRLEVTELGVEAIAKVEEALATRLAPLVEGDHREVLEVLRGVISGVGASLDRERRVAIG